MSPCSSTNPSNFSGPRQAKRRETSSWPSPSTLTPKMPLRAHGIVAVRAMVDGDEHQRRLQAHRANALTVRPAGACPSRRGSSTTVTPVANCESARRKAASSTGMEWRL